ncbi:uncharacterized protein L969DRAFT_16252 [Mixia osmundae IAM 14324]|uniref:Uncharacterized protein n=1 Tax=Mixia osmundae (strain CBS 9802 / IAM 14324 / JCM 22182 / KY 12970) TaxID=764103 RepID=G7EAR8_MIXOS|nr:uncharacterized protein L969DRAFT_16252 [Mixia osmundae IAM 14324]KEI40897.1 hypothetical protein L969DRAFT_16252 [Mixia osmundae IAM 14324]GAA99928.1 hypothetical protein E5Q_06631 [Mixia osmundae IAM 14324]
MVSRYERIGRSQQHPRRTVKLDARARYALLVALALGAIGFLGFSFLGKGEARPKQGYKAAARRKAKCDPYRLPGRLIVDRPSYFGTRWEPYDDACQPRSIVASLNTSRTDASLAWLRDRTIMILGTRQDRANLEYFCEHANGSMETYLPDNSLTPAIEGSGWANSASFGKDTATAPISCYVERYELLMMAVSHFGLIEEEQDYTVRGWYPPVAAEDRIAAILLPLHANLAKRWQRDLKVDLVELGASVWDALLPEGDDAGITERLGAWINSLQTILIRLAKSFEGSPIVLARSLPRDDSTSMAIDSAMRYTIDAIHKHIKPAISERIILDESGALLSGQRAYSPANAVLWADVILWELHNKVS